MKVTPAYLGPKTLDRIWLTWLEENYPNASELRGAKVGWRQSYAHANRKSNQNMKFEQWLFNEGATAVDSRTSR